MKKLIIKSLKILSLGVLLASGFIIPSSNDVNAQVRNTVPDYYYANYKFADSWDKIWETFGTIKSRQELGMDISKTYFSELSKYFKESFPHLPQDYHTTYEKCELLADNLAEGVSDEKLKSFLGNSCYKKLNQAVGNINSSYTVKVSATSNPSEGAAPLTVTFNAGGSIDPSSETIPKDNYFWYYRDENGIDTPMGIGNVINYEFKEAGKFIVHLVVRSSNVDKGILDGEKDLTINVSPKTANIVVYANTRKMSTKEAVKIGTTEGINGVIFDGSATRVKEGNKIESHTRTITNQSVGFSYSKTKNGMPSYTEEIYLKDEGEYKVTLSTKDNEKNIVSETFSLYVSDPVSVIRQTPAEGTTSSTFVFDGGASYSLSSRLDTYLWEIFNEEGNKTKTEQGKKMSEVFKSQGNYLVRLTVTDLKGKTNQEIKNVYVESTTPTPQFTITPTSKRLKASEFTLDASNSSDIDVMNGVDALEYERLFSTDDINIVSTENNNEKIVVQFNKKGKQKITLRVTDKYGKSATISKEVDIQSVLRPEITAIPGAIEWTKAMRFESSVNKPVVNYNWKFGDDKNNQGESLVNINHNYSSAGVYSVNLEVNSLDGDSNTVTERVFIGEVDYPIAAYRIKDSKGFFIQATETCNVSGTNGNKVVEAYPIDRYSKFTINPSISVNTQGKSNGLKYAYEIEGLMGENKAKDNIQDLTHSFNFMGCHFIDLTVYDSNVGKQNKTRIWFNVKNAKPTIKNVSIVFPQYSDENQYSIGLNTTEGKTTFNCSGNDNLTVKVTAVGAEDTDGSISRLRFYYYNMDDPSRILEVREGLPSTPYVYFVIPRIAGEYKFGVMVYDSDGDMIDSRDYLGNNPSIYFPVVCDSSDIPSVTLKVSNTNIDVGDTVTYTAIAKISSNNENFEIERTFYYDFTGDGIWDLTTKKDTVSYTFMEAYEDGIQPRVAVEYRNKIGKADGAKIIVRNGIKPILVYTSYKNIVLFRDLSVGELTQRKICFEESECLLGKKKFIKSHSVVANDESLTIKADNPITKNDMFIQRYSDYGNHQVSIELKDKYGMTMKTGYIVKTSENTVNNGRIAPGVNILTIPETTFNNSNPEIFLTNIMNNTLLMYINYEGEGTCYIDIDVSVDSDGDGQTDNDIDSVCNTVAKLKYSPSYESAIGRVIFTANNGKQVFQNFYVSFEGYILELSTEDREIYDNISTLINGIDDRIGENANLKSSLDVLRKNLNNRIIVSSTVSTIKGIQVDGGISLDSKQKELLSDILSYLGNADTIFAVGTDEYEKNKEEILILTPASAKKEIKEMFQKFEENRETLDKEGMATELKKIRERIGEIGKKEMDKDDVLLFDNAFCNIFAYYDLTSYTKTCGTNIDREIQDNKEKVSSNSSSDKKGLPTWLIIVLTVLFGGLLVMGGIIVFFSLKSRLNKSEEDEEEG